MATINALCPVGSYSSQSRQTAVQKSARGAQTSILVCSSTTSLMNDVIVSLCSSSCDAHVDLIDVAFELTCNVNVYSMRRAAPRFDRDGALNDHASGGKGSSSRAGLSCR